MGVTATETACQVPSRLVKTRRKRWSVRWSSNSIWRRPRLIPVPPKTRTNCSLNVIDLTPRAEGLTIRIAFVMGSPKVCKPVKSSARMRASGERSPRRYASFHSLSRRNISASSSACVSKMRPPRSLARSPALWRFHHQRQNVRIGVAEEGHPKVMVLHLCDAMDLVREGQSPCL